MDIEKQIMQSYTTCLDSQFVINKTMMILNGPVELYNND